MWILIGIHGDGLIMVGTVLDGAFPGIGEGVPDGEDIMAGMILGITLGILLGDRDGEEAPDGITRTMVGGPCIGTFPIDRTGIQALTGITGDLIQATAGEIIIIVDLEGPVPVRILVPIPVILETELL